MAEPQDLKLIRDGLDNVISAVSGGGLMRGQGVTPELLATTIKVIQVLTMHVESLEDRIKALESRP